MAGKSFNVTLPRKVDELIALADSIDRKNEIDGAVSPIPLPWVTELKTLTSTAKTAEAKQKDLLRTTKDQLEAISLELGLAKGQSSFSSDHTLGMVASIRDFLRGHFRDNPRALGAWGFDVKSPKGVTKIEMPRDPESLLALVRKIVKKHDEDKSSSLLLSFDMTKLTEQADRIEPKIAEMLQGRKNAEQATQTRDRALGLAKGQTSKTRGTVLFLVASIRDILLGRFRGSERTLGEWGFVVNDAAVGPSPSGPVVPPPAP